MQAIGSRSTARRRSPLGIGLPVLSVSSDRPAQRDHEDSQHECNPLAIDLPGAPDHPGVP